MFYTQKKENKKKDQTIFIAKVSLVWGALVWGSNPQYKNSPLPWAAWIYSTVSKVWN